jgi:cytochrome c554/c'-like protein
MLNSWSQRLFTAGSVVILCLVSRFVASALDVPHKETTVPDQQAADYEPAAASQRSGAPEALPQDAATNAQPQPDAATEQVPAPLADQSYVGTNQCFMCHRPHTNAWSETKHAQAFAHLPENYQKDSSCLKCHVTGFGEQRGYVVGTDKDLMMVGCESCHGPGAQHIDAAQRFVMAATDEGGKLEKAMRETVVKIPNDTVCIKCHITQAHQRHPPYIGQPVKQVVGIASHTVSHAKPGSISPAPAWHSSRFNIKTCGSCHYDRYKQWTTEKHAQLFAELPAKYWNDEDCAKCHARADAVARDTSGASEQHHASIGVACESCHGPALEHLRFTRRFISGPPLGPQLERTARHSIRKGKPSAGCVQCHVEQGHKEHPQFEKR